MRLRFRDRLVVGKLHLPQLVAAVDVVVVAIVVVVVVLVDVVVEVVLTGGGEVGG